MLRFVFALLIFIAPFSAQAESRNLACRSAENLVSILDRLVNMNQLLNNSVGQTVSKNQLNRAFCDFPVIRSGTTGRLDGYFPDQDSGLIYVVFRIEIPTVRAGTDIKTGNTFRMYAVDSVVPMSMWEIRRDRQCGWGYRGDCLVPKVCEAIDNFWFSGNLLGFINRQEIPDYVRLARNQCQQYIVR